jgi:GNAT superfamily N-acetyltransferase
MLPSDTTLTPPSAEPRKYSIRQATPDDLDVLIGLGETFFAYSPYSAEVNYDPESVRSTLISVMGNPGAIALVAEHDGKIVGGMVGVMTVLWFNRNVAIATELAWWMDPDHRAGRVGLVLFRRFEAWAKEMGAQLLVMSDFGSEKNPRVSRLFEQLDLRCVERSHFKALH